MNEIKILNYSPRWENSHVSFATEYFHGRRKRINPEYIYWKYRGVKDQALDSFLLAVDGDKVIGQLGLIPCQVNVNNKQFSAQWACDLMVHKNYRGKGVGKMLYNEAVKRKITLGSDPSPSASISMERFGFKNIEGPMKAFFPIYLNAITDKKIKRLSFITRLLPNPLLILYYFRAKQNYGLHKVFLKENWRFNKFVDNLKSINPFAKIVHDEDFYSWRLSKFKTYQEQGDLFEKENEFLFTIRKSSSIFFIGDFLFISLKQARVIIKNLIIQAFKDGATELKLTTGDLKLIQLLKSMGFIFYRTRTKIIYYSKDKSFLNEMALCNYFEYTYLDSDENI